MRRKASRAARRLTLATVAAAIVGGLGLSHYAASLRAAAATPGPTTDVLVAGHPLARGSIVAASDLVPSPLPAGAAPPGAFTDPAPAAGRVLLAPLATGEALTETRLGPRRAGPVAALVPEGFRAFAVAASLPGEAVRPGDRVDVVATFAGGSPHTETAVAGAEVLLVLAGGASGSDAAGGAGLTAEGSGGPTFVLLVTPEDAERLAYARAFADLTVTIAPAGS